MKTSMFKKVLALALCVWMICTIGMTAFAATGQPYEEVKSIEISPSSLTIYYGETAKLTATVYPSGANPKVLWQSSDPNLVAVDSKGNLSAVKETSETPDVKKTVTITAISDENSGIRKTCTVTVEKKPVHIDPKSFLETVIELVKSLAAKIDVDKIVEAIKGIDFSKVTDLLGKVIDIVKQLIGGAGKTTTAV